MAFDPFSGDLWEQENGNDSFLRFRLRIEGNRREVDVDDRRLRDTSA